MSLRDKRTLKYAAATDIQSSKDYMYLTDPHDEYTQLDLYIKYNSKEVYTKAQMQGCHKGVCTRMCNNACVTSALR